MKTATLISLTEYALRTYRNSLCMERDIEIHVRKRSTLAQESGTVGLHALFDERDWISQLEELLGRAEAKGFDTIYIYV